MFGYVRPFVAELKVREFEHFRSCYCSLCHELGKRYGLWARMILNYDFTFLAMLLWDGGRPEFIRERCVLHPFRGRGAAIGSDSLKRCAGYSVLLSWWKLRDNAKDEHFFQMLLARGEMIWLSRAYRKARKDYPQEDEKVGTCLQELARMEEKGTESLDVPADVFARLLCAFSRPDETNDGRTLRQILYHVGRWIYLIDAADDLKEDVEKGRFNPLVSRFHPSNGELDPESKQTLRLTLDHSRNLAGSAFELREESYWSEILRNILYFGMERVTKEVLDGTFRNGRDGI